MMIMKHTQNDCQDFRTYQIHEIHFEVLKPSSASETVGFFPLSIIL